MLTRISAALMSLSPAEQRVGRLVLSDPPVFARLPVCELAALAQATAYGDSHMQLMSASVMVPGDCAVVISNSGRTRDLIAT